MMMLSLHATRVTDRGHRPGTTQETGGRREEERQERGGIEERREPGSGGCRVAW